VEWTFSNSPASKSKNASVAPTPDFGTLGPGSDVNPASVTNPNVDPTSLGGPAMSPMFAGSGPQGAGNPQPPVSVRVAAKKPALVLIVAGFVLAMLGQFITLIGPLAAERFREWFGRPGTARAPVAASSFKLDRGRGQTMQRHAEVLLEDAIAEKPGAAQELVDRAQAWRGQLQMTTNLNSILTAALNSNDMQTRAAGIEVELVAYNIAKVPSEVDRLTAMASSSDHASKIWALWMLGALANRGVETDAVTEMLVGHLKDTDVTSRQWAVEGLALIGNDASIAPLLGSFHDDPSPAVRERAACGLAEAGMLTREQRMTAVPQILNYAEDPALDSQTRNWAFQALRDITGQKFGNDSGRWRDWWEKKALQSTLSN